MSVQNKAGEGKEISPEIKKIRDADLLIGAALLIVFGWTALESIKMSVERIRLGTATIYTSPGLFPFIISITIMLCTLSVIRKAIADGADLNFLKPSSLKSSYSSPGSFSSFIVLGSLCFYVFVLIPYIPFTLATFVFTAGFMLFHKAGKPIWTILISLIFSLVVVNFFSMVVGVRFPVRYWLF